MTAFVAEKFNLAEDFEKFCCLRVGSMGFSVDIRACRCIDRPLLVRLSCKDVKYKALLLLSFEKSKMAVEDPFSEGIEC